jgi:hypothetical protein
MMSMANCRYKKILQFYLDGSGQGHDFTELEEHLKNCAECQIELAELEEINGAALDIVDEAPEREYWESFPIRVRNRIIARNIEPAVVKHKEPWYATFRIASVLVVLVLIAGFGFLVLQRGLTVLDNSAPISDIIGQSGNQDPVPPPTLESALPELSSSGITDLSVEPAPIISNTLGSPGEPSFADREAVFDNKKPETSLSPIEINTLDGRFRDIRLVGAAVPKLETEIKSYTPIFASYLADIDPSFHMKESFIKQRLLSAMNYRSHSAPANGLLHDNAVTEMGGKVRPTNETSSIWGYTSISSDTSDSEEMRKYFLELELMQSK